jgi:sugar phosphate isomerase/epimerase
MNFSRRQFLLTGATLASGSMLQSFDFLNENAKLKTFGVQLYTLRDDLPKDPKGVLKQLGSFGYKQVESFEGQSGMFWGMTNKEFKAYLDELGMSIVSSHCDFKKDFERKAAEAGEIGMKYLICPYLGPQKSIDAFKKAADDFNKAGEICKKNGLRFAYHNHNYSFNKQEGQLPQDVMMQNSDPALVDFEMDIYWVVSAGADPIEWMKKYPNRFKLCHIKDRAKNAAPTNFDASVDLGTGSVDFKTILAEGKKYGFQYHIVEQEKYENTTPLKSAEVDAAYLKSLKF